MGNMVENMTPEMAMGMLKYIQNNDIIDLSYVQEMKEMAERDNTYSSTRTKSGKERTESGEHIFQTKRRLMAEN